METETGCPLPWFGNPQKQALRRRLQVQVDDLEGTSESTIRAGGNETGREGGHGGCVINVSPLEMGPMAEHGPPRDGVAEEFRH